MPKRQREKKVPSEDVMGEDSYVIVRSPKYENIVKAIEMTSEEEQEGNSRAQQLAQMKFGEDLLEECIVEWNWVDDDGKPMPQYGNGTKATDLSLSEVTFLLDKILGDSRRKK